MKAIEEYGIKPIILGADWKSNERTLKWRATKGIKTYRTGKNTESRYLITSPKQSSKGLIPSVSPPPNTHIKNNRRTTKGREIQYLKIKRSNSERESDKTFNKEHTIKQNHIVT